MIAAVIGTLVSGRVTDAMVRRGLLEARIWVPAVCYLGATVLFIPGILADHLTPALWFDMAGAALLSAANPPLDAARLDIMPAGLWGRAESTRTVARSLAQALAPVALRADRRPDRRHRPDRRRSAPTPTTRLLERRHGLEFSFLIMLVTLGAAGWFMLRARHTYARDIAAAAASQEAVARGQNP